MRTPPPSSAPSKQNTSARHLRRSWCTPPTTTRTATHTRVHCNPTNSGYHVPAACAFLTLGRFAAQREARQCLPCVWGNNAVAVVESGRVSKAASSALPITARVFWGARRCRDDRSHGISSLDNITSSHSIKDIASHHHSIKDSITDIIT